MFYSQRSARMIGIDVVVTLPVHYVLTVYNALSDVIEVLIGHGIFTGVFVG